MNWNRSRGGAQMDYAAHFPGSSHLDYFVLKSKIRKTKQTLKSVISLLGLPKKTS